MLWAKDTPRQVTRPRSVGVPGSTAASLWVTGAIGISVGLGIYDVAIMLAIVAFATLRLLPPFKQAVRPKDKADQPDH